MPSEQRGLGDVDEADRLAEMVLVLVDVPAQRERRDVERLAAQHVLVDVDRAAGDADGDRGELEEEEREESRPRRAGSRACPSPATARRSCRRR